MHHTKRAARVLAWRDQNNPFAKTGYHRKVPSQLSQLERGEIGDQDQLVRVRTDDPSNYRESPSSANSAENYPQHQTAPSAVSRRREHELGDEIGDIPATRSPEASVKDFDPRTEKKLNQRSEDVEILPDYNESRTATGVSSAGETRSKRGLGKWVKSWKSHDSEKALDSHRDDDNGKQKTKFTPWSQVRNTIFNSKINFLFIACPIGIALHAAKANSIAIFVVNFIAIIPLAAMLSFATEEIALRVGEVLGGLLNASFGNAVELIVSIIALVKNEILIVQTSLIGSILSNLLLVLGMCFFGGGVNRIEQNFNMTVAQTASSLLFLAVAGLLIPTVFAEWANTGQTGDQTSSTNAGVPTVPDVKPLSLATAVVLLFVYLCYLFFQLKSHTIMYAEPSKKNEKRDMTRQKARVKRLVPSRMRRKRGSPASAVAAGAPTDATARSNSPSVRSGNDSAEPVEEAEEPQLSFWVAVFTLAAATVLVAINAEFLVASIDDITRSGKISKTFVGLILLPIVGNAAEHATSVTVAIKDKMDLAIGVAVGSSMQIALLVLPFMVVLGQIIGKDDMTLQFDGFQIAVLFVAVLLVNYLIQDGKSHWLEGVLLIVLYIIIAVAAWYYPTVTDPNTTTA